MVKRFIADRVIEITEDMNTLGRMVYIPIGYYQKLEALNAELVEALENMVRTMWNSDYSHMDAAEKAKAALKRARKFNDD